IASDALWQEIRRSENTCGIKVAFTVTRDEKGLRYGRLREIAALHDGGNLVPPRFDEPAPAAQPAPAPAAGDDRNPQARVTFTDGTVMEDAVHTGALLFYNPDKFFGRLRAEDGERFYFRSGDVMQKSLLDFLNARSALDIEETLVTFSIKRLPTGKLAAGRVSWPQKGGKPVPDEAKPGEAAGEAEPAADAETGAKAEPAAETAPAGKAAPLDAYCAAYLRAWGGEEDALRGHLLLRAEEAAREGDEQSAQDLLLECAALSDARREKRDEAMLAYLRRFAREDAGEDLAGFLGQAGYSGVAMFDALTRLYAAADGAMGRLCGILCQGEGLVTLRAELLRRFGCVPETAQELRAAWQPLVAEERARTDWAALPLTDEGLAQADPEGKHPEWAAALQAVRTPSAPALLRAREEILRHPLRPAVAFLLPAILDAQEKLQEESGAKVSLRALCRVRVLGQDYAVLEAEGAAGPVAVELGGSRAAVDALRPDEETALAFPYAEAEGTARVTGEAEGAAFCEDWALAFPAAVEAEAGEDPVRLVEREGVVAFVDAPQAVEAVAQAADAACIRVSAGAFASAADAQGAEAAILSALRAQMEERYGAEVAGLLSFPYAGEATEGALERVLRDFADVRLLHDKLKGAHILLTAAARDGAVEPLCALCARLAGPSVRAALAVDAVPAGTAVFAARGGTAGVAEALRREGYAASRVILAEPLAGAAAQAADCPDGPAPEAAAADCPDGSAPEAAEAPAGEPNPEEPAAEDPSGASA
ncbi:MAG: hypothetical protein ACOX83_12345, partial [Candidatus Spyradocola sp.]